MAKAKPKRKPKRPKGKKYAGDVTRIKPRGMDIGGIDLRPAGEKNPKRAQVRKKRLAGMTDRMWAKELAAARRLEKRVSKKPMKKS